MTQTRDLIKKMADFFTGEEFYEKGEDARLELSPDDVRCMNEIIKACGNAISRQAVLDIIHCFFTEEVDKIPTKKTEDGEVIIMCKAQPLFAMNKTLCKRIKALPSDSPTQNCVGNALDMRCDDAISRQAVRDALYKLCNTNETLIENPWRDNSHIDALIDAIEELPSVNPQEKTGHWERISIDKYSEHAKYWYKCDRCGKDNLGNTDWCPNCGAKMFEPQESEG